jgi:hypothetical protein
MQVVHGVVQNAGIADEAVSILVQNSASFVYHMQQFAE